MTIETLAKLIKNRKLGHSVFVEKAEVAERYFDGMNDICLMPKKDDANGNPLRNADNRVPRNFYKLLVNQKVTYGLLTPPVFDVGNEQANERVVDALGDDYVDMCASLGEDASKCGVAWAHYWRGIDGTFQWSPVDPKCIIAVKDSTLKHNLIGVLRVYIDVDDEGIEWTVYEYWDAEYVCVYRKRGHQYDDHLEELAVYEMFTDPVTGEPEAYYAHGLGAVPFVEFRNNKRGTNDLVSVKRLIDVYDKVYNGFANDLDDIQEIIFILTNYGGQSYQEFIEELKKYKVISVDEDGGVKTLNIEIPTEAREKLLEITRKAIFEQGFGFDPEPKEFGNQSGVALSFMYALLEQKTALMEIQFRGGFNRLVRAILNFYGLSAGKIVQTWTRSKIRNELEQSQICQQSVGIISERTILAHHPYVEDVNAELRQIEKERSEREALYDPFAEPASEQEPEAE